MMTIKVVTHKESSKKVELPERDQVFLIEGSNINYQFYEADKNFYDDGNTMFELAEMQNVWFINPKKDVAFCIIKYVNDGGYQCIILFNYAKMYIMQNGKTIDSIVV